MQANKLQGKSGFACLLSQASFSIVAGFVLMLGGCGGGGGDLSLLNNPVVSPTITTIDDTSSTPSSGSNPASPSASPSAPSMVDTVMTPSTPTTQPLDPAPSTPTVTTQRSDRTPSSLTFQVPDPAPSIPTTQPLDPAPSTPTVTTQRSDRTPSSLTFQVPDPAPSIPTTQPLDPVPPAPTFQLRDNTPSGLFYFARKTLQTDPSDLGELGSVSGQAPERVQNFQLQIVDIPIDANRMIGTPQNRAISAQRQLQITTRRQQDDEIIRNIKYIFPNSAARPTADSDASITISPARLASNNPTRVKDFLKSPKKPNADRIDLQPFLLYGPANTRAYDYSYFGFWDYSPSGQGLSNFAAFATGVTTPVANLPRRANARYTGLSLGAGYIHENQPFETATESGQVTFRSDFNLNANFANNSFDATFTNFKFGARLSDTPPPFYVEALGGRQKVGFMIDGTRVTFNNGDINGNQLSGTVTNLNLGNISAANNIAAITLQTTPQGNPSGTIKGRFTGPAGEEVTGVWSVRQPYNFAADLPLGLGTIEQDRIVVLVGGFGAKR